MNIQYQLYSYLIIQSTSILYIRGKKFSKKFAKDKNYRNVRVHCHFTGKYTDATHITYNLRFNVPNEIPVVFHNGSNYDYYSIIKELANYLEEQFECLGENTKKHNIIFVSR